MPSQSYRIISGLNLINDRPSKRMINYLQLTRFDTHMLPRNAWPQHFCVTDEFIDAGVGKC